MRSADDPYRILDVPRDVTLEDLKSAYRKRVRETHPDLSNGTSAADFVSVAAAYQTLKKSLEAGPTPRTPPRKARTGGAAKPCFGEILLDIQLEDLLGTRAIAFQTANFRCEACIQGEQGVTCPECSGAGRIQQYQTHIATLAPCPTCNGKGRLAYGEPGHCAIRYTTMAFRVPRGARHGERLVLPVPDHAPGLTAMAITRQIGVTLRVAPHPVYMVRGDDLYCHKTAEFSDFVLGAEIPITDLAGGLHVATLPPGFQNNGMVTIQGAGLPKKTGTSGDLVIQFEVAIPASANAAQRAAAELWRNESRKTG